MHDGDSTALTNLRGRRPEAWFIRHRIGVHNNSGSLQAAQTDLLPVTARRYILGVHCDQGDAQTQHTCSEFQNEVRFGRSAHILVQHPQLQSRTEHLPGRLDQSAEPSARKTNFREYEKVLPLVTFTVEAE
jgi:hypothetical protein